MLVARTWRAASGRVSGIDSIVNRVAVVAPLSIRRHRGPSTVLPYNNCRRRAVASETTLQPRRPLVRGVLAVDACSVGLGLSRGRRGIDSSRAAGCTCGAVHRHQRQHVEHQDRLGEPRYWQRPVRRPLVWSEVLRQRWIELSRYVSAFFRTALMGVMLLIVQQRRECRCAEMVRSTSLTACCDSNRRRLGGTLPYSIGNLTALTYDIEHYLLALFMMASLQNETTNVVVLYYGFTQVPTSRGKPSTGQHPIDAGRADSSAVRFRDNRVCAAVTALRCTRRRDVRVWTREVSRCWQGACCTRLLLSANTNRRWES
jgi:hypothetical protein